MKEDTKKALIAGALGAAGLYVGLSVWDAMAQLAASAPPDGQGPYKYGDLTFPNAQAMRAYLNWIRAGKLYPWLVPIRDEMAPLLLGAGLGMAGGAIEFFRQWLYRNVKFTIRESLSYPTLGLISGLMVLFTIVALPYATTLTGGASLAGIAFFSGVFSEIAFRWVTVKWRQWFGRIRGRQNGKGSPKQKGTPPRRSTGRQAM